MLITLEVSNRDKSIDFKEEQLKNIKPISTTWDELNEDKSIYFRDEQ